MKKRNLLTRMLLLFALIVGSTSVWADKATYTFTTSDWNATLNNNAANWTSGKNGNGFTSGQGIQVTTGTTGANATSPSSFSNISKIVVTYNTNKSAGEGSIEIKIGNNAKKSNNVAYSGSSDGRSANFTTEFNYSTAETGSITITVNTTTNSIWVKSIEITYSADSRPYVATIGDLGFTTLDFGATGTFAPTITPAEGLSSSDYTVAWTEVDNEQILLTEDGEYVAGTTKGSVDVTVTITPTSSSYQAVSKTFTLKIVDPNAGDGTLAKPFRPSDAIDAYNNNELDSETEYYVAGTISRIGDLDDGALTYYISDDGSTTSELECYKGKGLEGANFTSATDLEVGDIVTVKGKVLDYESDVYMRSGNTIISITPRRTKVNITTFSADETTLVVNETTYTTVTNDVTAWTTASYIYNSNNGSVATVDGNGVIHANAKGTATITVTPNIAADDANYRVGASKTIDITVTNPLHNVIFSVNGITTASEVEEGDAITFPADPSDLGGLSFVGWTTAAIVGKADNATLVNKATEVMEDADKAYYAVFANVISFTEESWTETALADMTASDVFVFSNGSYAMTNNNGTGSAPAATSITVSNGKITSNVTDAMKWNVTGNATNGYTFYKNGENTYLYCNTTASSSSNNNIRVGTGDRKLWVFNNNGYLKTNDENTTRYLSIYNNQDFRGYINTTNGAFVPKFYKHVAGSFICEDYCTSITDTKTVESYGWATYIPEYPVQFEANTAYVVTDASVSNGLTVEAVTSVPANTPVLLKGAGEKTMIVLAVAPAEPDDNLLTIATATTPDGKFPYVLAKNGTGACFKQWTGAAATLEGRVVLYLDNAIASARSFFALDGEEATGINEIQEMKTVGNEKFYNLNGQRIAQPAKGLYIVNGKKYIVK